MAGLTVGELVGKLGIDDKEWNSKLDLAHGKFAGLSSNVSQLTGAIGLGAGVAGLSVAAIGIAAVKMGAEFDAAYDGIRLGTGATGAKLEGLKDTFKQVVTDVPASFGDASAAITGLNQRMEITGPRLRDLADQFLELSHITGSDVSENVRLGTRLFGDWSIKTDKQAGALDQLFRATQKSGIGLSDLMSTVVQFGAPLRNMGFGFSESIAMLAKWEKEGVNTSTVLTGMKFALKTFAKAGLEPQEALAAITAKIHDTTNAQEAMTLGMQTFGLRAGPDMVAAIREGRFQYQKFAETIANGRDTIRGAAKDTADMGEGWTRFSNLLKVKTEPALTGLFTGLSNAMAHPFSSVTGWFDEPVDDAKASIASLETRLDELRAKVAERMAMGKLDNDKWIDAITRTQNRLNLLKDTARKPMAVGHLQNKPWNTGIGESQNKLNYFKSLTAAPMYSGHLNPGGWTDGINTAISKMAYFRSLVRDPMYVGHISGGTGGLAEGGLARGPKSGYYQLMHGEEVVTAVDNPTKGLSELNKRGLLPSADTVAASARPEPSRGDGGRTNKTSITVQVNAPVYGVDELHDVIYSATMAAMEEAELAEVRSRRGYAR